MKAFWNDTLLAESDDIVMFEGNAYFPEEALIKAYFIPSSTVSRCPRKGDASYYHIVVNDERNEDAAWIYRAPRKGGARIAGRVAFGKGVRTTAGACGALRPPAGEPDGRNG